MAKKSHSEFAPKYEIGDKVRVIHGFMDVDYPDMPLDGWAGTVKDVQGSDTFTVRWRKETLKAIHPDSESLRDRRPRCRRIRADRR